MKQKILSAKKAALTTLALIFASCAGFAVALGAKNETAYAADGDTVTVTLSGEDFTSSGTEVTGISDTGKGKLTGEFTSVTLEFPDGATVVNYDFFECEELFDGDKSTAKASLTLSLPASLAELNQEYFDDFEITDIAVASGNTVFSVSGGSLIKGGSELYMTTSAVTEIPTDAAITSVNAKAFCGRSFESVFVPANITALNGALSRIDGLTYVTVDGANTVYSDGDSNCVIETNGGVKTLVFVASGAAAGGSMAVPDGVTAIASGVFSGLGATEITLPETVTEIAEGAFAGSAGLTSLSLPFVGKNNEVSADAKENLFGYIFGTTESDGCTFAITQKYSASETQTYYLPDALTSIRLIGVEVKLADWAFYDVASKAVGIEVLDDVQIVGEEVFGLADGSEAAENGFLGYANADNAGYLWLGNSQNGNVILLSATEAVKSKGMVVIPDTKIIYENAFANAAFENVVLPASLTKICDDAFDGCNNIVNVYNRSALEITAGADTHGKVALTATNVYGGSDGAIVTYGNYTFMTGDDPVLLQYSGAELDVVLPKEFDGKRYSINDGAFEGNAYLQTIEILQNSVTDIGEGAFRNCTELTRVTIASGVESFGDSLFEGCSMLVSASISGIDKVSNSFFKDCSSLTSVDFVNCNVTEIGDNAFDGCSSLNEIVVPDSVVRIGNEAYKNCSSALDFSIGNNVEYIGYRAFAFTSSLKSAKIPDSVTALGKDAGKDELFLNSGVETVEIGGSYTALGYTFYGCERLVSVTFSDSAKQSVTDFSNAFAGCTKLETLVIPDNAANLDGILSGARNLKSLTVSAGALPAGKLDATTVKNYALFAQSEAAVYAGLNVVFPASDGISDYGARVAEFIGAFDYNNVTTLGAYDSVDYNEVVKSLVYLNNALFIFPDQASYTAVIEAMTEDWYKANVAFAVSAVQTNFPLEALKGKLFFETELIYEIYKSGETEALASDKEVKLARSETYGGADIRYSLTALAGGGEYYAIDEEYALPESVGAYVTAADGWTLDESEITEVGTIKLYGPTTIKNTLTQIDVNIETEYVKDYDGKAWQLPEKYNGVVGIVSINPIDGELTEGEAVNAGVYTVTLGLIDENEGNESVNTVTATLTIRQATAELEWRLGNGSPVTEGEVPVLTYDGNSIFSQLNVSFVGVNGNEVVSLTDLTRELNGQLSSADPSGAGLWRFTLRDSRFPNYDFSHISQQIRISPRSVELFGTVREMKWMLEEHQSDLDDRTIYVYTKSGADFYFTAPTSDSGYTFKEIIDGTNSVARYRDALLTLAIRDAADYSFTIAPVNGKNTGRDKGMYVAEFTFTADGNHVFTFNQNASVAGLEIIINGNGESATVKKTWYIVEISNDFVTDGGNDYVIAGWTFGGRTPDIVVPVLMNGDVSSENYGTTDDKVSFVLRLNGTQVGEKFTRYNFTDYINASMPAGNYTLAASVETFSYGGVVQSGFTREYDFTVRGANIGLNLSSGDKGYASYEWEYDAENKGGFFDGFAETLGNKVALASITPRGYWADAGSSYYGGYTITYNFARMNTDTYYGVNDMLGEIKKDSEARKDGYTATYTVYFDIAAKNHNNLTATGTNRYTYYFTVNVYEVIDAPEVYNVTYTGVKILPTFEESDLYEVVWDSNDTYINGGTHNVTFRLYDSDHYRWRGTSSDAVRVAFAIEAARNDWTRYPGVIGWSYGTFSVEDNRIIAVPQFIDSGETVTFYVSYDAEGKNKVDGLTAITVDADGKVIDADGRISTALNTLGKGTYYLNASLPATANYRALEAKGRSFEIIPLINEWDVSLGITTWIVGSYGDLEEFPIVGTPKFGEVIVKIVDANNAEKVYYEGANGTDELKEVLAGLGVGNYLLTARVEGAADGNYSSLVADPVLFQVFAKAGLPWWAILLIVIAVLGVVALVMWILHEKGVIQLLTGKIVVAMRTKMTIDATIAAVRANKRAEESRRSIEQAERQERMEAARRAREEERNKTPEERAAALEERAAQEEAKAKKSQKRAERLQDQAKKLKGDEDEEGEADATEGEGSADDSANNTDEE